LPLECLSFVDFALSGSLAPGETECLLHRIVIPLNVPYETFKFRNTTSPGLVHPGTKLFLLALTHHGEKGLEQPPPAPTPRARQTAEIIAPALGVALTFDDAIQELRPGEAEGMPVETFRKTYGEPDYEEDPYRQMAPGGENWGQFMLRVGTAFHRITHEHEGKTIVLVCHGGVIDGSFLYFFQTSAWTLPPARFYTRNTSITQWQQITS
jgi:Histidine phosphatase superfamily (branch 1)